jgi:diguanylate cyclase (GGDEF)-like protein/PAS domain S-box-containing protein
MPEAKVPTRRASSTLTVLCAVLALLAWTAASVCVGRLAERADPMAAVLDGRGSPLLLDAAMAALLALAFAVAARRSARASARRSGIECPEDALAPARSSPEPAAAPCKECEPASLWQRWQHLTDDMPIAISYFDLSETCLFANEAARRRYGHIAADDLRFSLRQAVGAHEHAQNAHHWQTVKCGFRVAYESADPYGGCGSHQTTHLIPDFDDSGAVQGFCMRVIDTSTTQAAETARAEGARHLKSITDNMPALITYINTDRVVTFANATFKTWLGSDPALMVGRPLVDLIGEAMYTQRLAFLERGFAGEQFTFELRSQTAAGERDLNTTYIPDFRSDGTVAGIFVLVTDVTPMRSVERQLHQIARLDTLTQLANRLQFDEKLAEALARARRLGKDMALMFMDIDHFKVINDTHGHAAGDAVLVEFAARLTSCVRETDTVARLGGDEFVVLIEGVCDASEVSGVADRFCAELAVAMAIEGQELIVTSSIGIALVDEADDTPAAVLAKADAALYSAKRAGRNRYAVAGKIAARLDCRPA